MNKAIILTAAVVLVAVARAGAVEIDWTQDAVSQIKSEMGAMKPSAEASFVSAADKAAVLAAAQGAIRIEAVARGSSIISENGKGWDEEISLATNNDGDRVGADYSTCDPATEHSADSVPTCGYASFSFPQLTVSGKSVLLNGEVIANIKKGFFSTHVKLVKGYSLKAVKTPVTVDGGFDRSRVTKVSVYIQKTN
jgi:hypothetical protein